MHHRLPVFQTDKFKNLLCEALNDARKSSGMLYFAYAIMPDHFHIITDGSRKPSDSLRFLNGQKDNRSSERKRPRGFASQTTVGGKGRWL
jgi:REP element-mobilizing transposase RayT